MSRAATKVVIKPYVPLLSYTCNFVTNSFFRKREAKPSVVDVSDDDANVKEEEEVFSSSDKSPKAKLKPFVYVIFSHSFASQMFIDFLCV